MQTQHPEKDEQIRQIKQLYVSLEANNLRPELVNGKLIGYHGTSERNAKLIVQEQHIFETNEEAGLLGRGAYFFENEPFPGPEVAQAWAKYKRQYPAQLVVAARIGCERIWDLTLNSNRAYFQFVLDWFVDTVRRVDPDRISLIRVNKVIKFILVTCPEREQIECVRWNGFRLDEIDVKSQRGLVVRKAKCIEKMWIHAER